MPDSGSHAKLIAEALASPVGHWEEVKALADALEAADRQKEAEAAAACSVWMERAHKAERRAADAEAALARATEALEKIGYGKWEGLADSEIAVVMEELATDALVALSSAPSGVWLSEDDAETVRDALSTLPGFYALADEALALLGGKADT